MKGAVFYTSKYGSTEQYAQWIGKAVELPVFNTEDKHADLSQFDFLIIGSPIFYYKLLNLKWIKANLVILKNKKIILFTVSGAPPGPKLDGWLNDCLPKSLHSQIKHFALRGRQNPKELTVWDWVMLKIAGLKNPDPVSRKEEMKGFDYMDKDSIEPIVNLIQKYRDDA